VSDSMACGEAIVKIFYASHYDVYVESSKKFFLGFGTSNYK